MHMEYLSLQLPKRLSLVRVAEYSSLVSPSWMQNPSPRLPSTRPGPIVLIPNLGFWAKQSRSVGITTECFADHKPVPGISEIGIEGAYGMRPYL